MKTILILILSGLSLPASAGWFGTLQSSVAENGARAADEARETAEWVLCNGISVGAWRRAYGADPARAAGWRALCRQPDVAPAPEPEAAQPEGEAP